MRTAITDPQRSASFLERLRTWFKQQSKESFTENIITPGELAELPLYKLTFIAEAETRAVAPFTRPDAAPVTAPPSVTAADQVDPWSIEGEKVSGFINYRQVIEIPGSLSSAPCSNCKGKTSLVCPACQGQKTVYCQTCRGDGKIDCPTCKHTKRMPCLPCKGIGRVYDETKQTYVNCANCQGKGDFPCPDCTDGFRVCPSCEGKKRLPCKDCNEAGTLPCPSCGGKGNILSGMSVEIVMKPREEKQELANDEIPAAVLSKMLPAVKYEEVSIEQGLPEEVTAVLRTLEAKVSAVKDARITAKKARVEKRPFYRLSFKIGGAWNAAWFAGENIYFEKDPLLEFKNMRRKAEKRLAASYLAGSIIGAFIISAASFSLIKHRFGGSLHINSVLLNSFLVNLAAAALTGLCLHIFLRKGFGTFKQRLFTGLGSCAGLLLIFYASAYVSGYNPAAGLDAKQMQREYKDYFPFGLRTLSSDADIAFLEGLVKKYKPTGIDLSTVQKDLAWLKVKRAKDKKLIKQVDKIRENMEKVRDTGIKKKRRYRR